MSGSNIDTTFTEERNHESQDMRDDTTADSVLPLPGDDVQGVPAVPDTAGSRPSREDVPPDEPVTDPELMTLNAAANILRYRGEHTTAAAVFNVLAKWAGGGANKLASRPPVDREQASREARESVLRGRAAINAAVKRGGPVNV